MISNDQTRRSTLTADHRDDSDRLKNCPFCGSDAEFGEIGGNDESSDAGGHFVQCLNSACGASSALIFPLMDDVKHLLLERWNRRERIAPYAAGTPPVGLFALREAIRCLRKTGRFVDEEGEATNALADLLDRLTARSPS